MIDEHAFREQVVALCRNGRKIEAIKLYREVTGKGLAQAKGDVEAWERGERLDAPLAPMPSQDDASVEALLRNGQKIEAIKLVRQRTGLGLAEAKDAVEDMERRLRQGESVAASAPSTYEPGVVQPPPPAYAPPARPQSSPFGVGHVERRREPFGQELPPMSSGASSGMLGVFLLLALVGACVASGMLFLLR